jgi:beta-lactam-binding protein with PASTA domain
VGFGRLALSAAGKVGVVLAVIAAFVVGLLATVYLSLRTSEVKVPDVLGKDRLTAENMLDDAGLKIRVRGARPSAEQPDTILSQLPEAGQVVKVGIPVAVEISRAPKEGESVPAKEEFKEEPGKPAENANGNANANANQSTATNQNQNQNRSQRNKNKNANNANGKNANNSNGANANRGANGNRNANNANAPRNTNGGNRNATTAPNANRTPSNQNANRRAPAATPPPARPAATGTP